MKPEIFKLFQKPADQLTQAEALRVRKFSLEASVKRNEKKIASAPDIPFGELMGDAAKQLRLSHQALPLRALLAAQEELEAVDAVLVALDAEEVRLAKLRIPKLKEQIEQLEPHVKKEKEAALSWEFPSSFAMTQLQSLLKLELSALEALVKEYEEAHNPMQN